MTTYNVYLSGHVDETEEPWLWRNNIKEIYETDSTLEFIDPVEKFPEYDDNEREVVWWCINQAVLCDGLFVKWDNETLTVGTIIEITFAYIFHNPIVIWYEGLEDDISPFLDELSNGVYKISETSMTQLKNEMWVNR